MFSFANFRKKFLEDFWPIMPAVAALGLLSAYYFGITGTYWAVTGEFTRWGGHLLKALGVDVSDWGYFKIIGLQGNILTRVDGVMIIGMFAGCTAAAFWGNNVKFRLPVSKLRVFQALLGGFIAGFGARLGMGCNLASFFTGIPQFSAHAWAFSIAMIFGVYLGAKVALTGKFKSSIKMQKVGDSITIRKDDKEIKSRFKIGTAAFTFGVALGVYLIVSGSAKLGMATLFGVSFGLIISKAQICFTSAFRDIFTTGRTAMAKALIIAMIISTIGIFSYIMLGTPPKIMWFGLNAVVGGFLFGFGIVLAGGCECGWMYRAVEGQVHFWIVGLGNVLGSTALAIVWDDIAPFMALNFPKVNLLQVFGNYGGLFVNYALLMLLLAWVLYAQRIYFKKKGIANAK